jgi:regulatory protein
VFSEKTKKRPPKPPTKARLNNIALYYLKRYETSIDNLRTVLKRRIDKYTLFDKEYNKEQAYSWIDEIINNCISKNYINDERFSDFKIRSYLNSGKSKRYIAQKLKQKGIDEKIISQTLDLHEYNDFNVALKFAKKKKIGPFRETEEKRFQNKQKDLATLVRAGFEFSTAIDVLDYVVDTPT